MGILSRLRSLDGFSQKPLQEKNGNTSTSISQTSSMTEGLKVNSRSNISRRGSEAARSISSSTTTGIQNSPRPRSILPKAQTDQTVLHHSRKRSATNPNMQFNKIDSGLPTPFKGRSSDEENIHSSSHASTSQTSLQHYNDQRKGSAASTPSLHASPSTAASPFSMVEGEVVENSTFPTSGSLVTSSLRSKDHDSPRLFTASWHSPIPEAKFNTSSTMDYDDEGMAEEIADEAQSNDTMYANVNSCDQNFGSSLYCSSIDSNSQINFNKGTLGSNTLRKASSRLKTGFMRSTKRPSTADASMVDRRQASSWGSHSVRQSSEERRNWGPGLRLGASRKSTDSLTSTITVGSRNTMTRSASNVAPHAGPDSKMPLPVRDPSPASTRQRTRTPSSASSHSIKAVIRANSSPPTSRGGSQSNHESSSPILGPKSQNVESAQHTNGQSYSPAMNSPSLPSQQQPRSRQRMLADQASPFKNDQNIFKYSGFEKVSLSPAPRKRSKSRTNRSSKEYEKSIESAEPVPEIPSQYRDERRSSIATTYFNSEDQANESTLSSEDCDSIDHKSIIDDIPGFRTSMSTTTTTSAQQHTPQSSISGSSSMAQLYSNEKQFGTGESHASFESKERISTQSQSIDQKFQLLTPESFSSTSRSRLREIQNLSHGALRLNSV